MFDWLARTLVFLVALAIVSPAAFAQSASASGAAEQAARQQTQPGNNAPVWRDVRSEQPHFTTTKGRETGVLIQSGGETWRAMRNGWVIPAMGWLLVAVFLAIAAFYWWRGPIHLHEKPTGRLLQRFSTLERFTHWVMGISFCVLAVTGIMVMFGKYVLLPLLGAPVFALLTQIGKVLHNVTGPVFVVSLVLFIVLFVRDNLPSKDDLQWLKSAGGLVTGKHVPSHRFNAGEKVWFWLGVVVLCLIVSVSGLVLNFPNFDQSRATMQFYNLVHGVASGLVMAMALGHIYLGSIGMDGAYQSMRSGYVDETWAKEHHQYWYEAEKAKARELPAHGAPGGGAGPAVAHAPHEPRSIS